MVSIGGRLMLLEGDGGESERVEEGACEMCDENRCKVCGGEGECREMCPDFLHAAKTAQLVFASDHLKGCGVVPGDDVDPTDGTWYPPEIVSYVDECWQCVDYGGEEMSRHGGSLYDQLEACLERSDGGTLCFVLFPPMGADDVNPVVYVYSQDAPEMSDEERDEYNPTHVYRLSTK